MILILGMKHQREELYKVYINHDPVKTLTYSNTSMGGLCISMGKIVKMSFEEKNLKEMGK